ncbi:MAG: hypothetical protein EON50_17350 [Acidovorax sp.]|nr:MAG: hypothetical protein EON50_17350 [Acidovorax sp.]
MGLLSVLPAPALRFLRKLILSQGRRLGVDQMLAQSKRRALKAAVAAARHSAAYRTLLKEHGLDPLGLRAQSDPRQLPVLTKANTFGRFTLDQLSRPSSASELADVLTSSGREGRGHGFRLTSRDQHADSWFSIDLGLQDVFAVDQQPTLLVNCLPMGVVFHSRAVAVANVSVREDMACSILRDVGPAFEQTVVCTDPLFIRRLLDEARQAQVDWSRLNTSVIVGEEVLVEAQRDYIAARMGIDIERDPHRFIGSSFGVGELGLNLLFESRETIRIRRAMRHQPALTAVVCGSAAVDALPSLFCYNPLRSYVEILNPGPDGFGELCITMLDERAVIALPRYATGDLARLLSPGEMASAAEMAGTATPWLPMIAVQGRIKDRPLGWPSVESIKELIYVDHGIADQLTGAFRLQAHADGGVELVLQALRGEAAARADLREQLLALAAQRGIGELHVDVVAPDQFPWRPLLDYERKFAYVPSSGLDVPAGPAY